MSSKAVFEVVGAGSSGIEEMVKFIHDCEVLWAMLRFEFGSGSFARSKFIFLHFNGEDTPPIKRGKANSMTDKVKLQLEDSGPIHASLHFEQVKDVTLKNVFAEMKGLLVVDSMSNDAVALMKAYHEQMAKEAEQQESQKGGGGDGKAEAVAEPLAASIGEGGTIMDAVAAVTPAPPAPAAEEQPQMTRAISSKRRLLRRTSNLQTSAQLMEVGKTSGEINWALIGANLSALPLVGVGDGGVDELRRVAQDNEDQVLYGLLRMTSGEGRMMRDRWIMVHIIGHTVRPVKRGQGNSLRPQMERKFREFANFCVSVPDMSSEDVTQAALHDFVKTAVINDDDVAQDHGEQISIGAFDKFRSKESLDRLPSAASKDDVEAKLSETPAAEAGATQDAVEAVTPAPPAPAVEDSGSDSEPEVPLPPKIPATVNEAMELVRQGACNWALFSPTQKR